MGENNTRRSGSPITLSEISASTRSMLMSLGESLERWDISVSVFVRSTKESRPSSRESKRMERCWSLEWSIPGVFRGDSKDGM